MGKIKAALKQLRHSFYLPTLLAIVFFIIAVLLLFNTQMFRSFYLSLENDVYTMTRSQAAYQSENLSSLLNEFTNLSAKIVSDGQISHTAFSRDHVSARNALGGYDLSFYKYDGLIIYYPGEEYLLTADGTCKAEVAFPHVADPDALLQALQEITLPSVFSTTRYGASMEQSDLVFVYPNNRSSYVLFLLNHNTIQSMLNPDVQVGSQHVILDGSGTLLFSDCALEAEELQSIAGVSLPDAGIQTFELRGASYLLMGDSLPYGIRMFTLNQVLNQFDELNRVTNTNFICCSLIVLLGLAVLAVSFMRSYMPIAKLAQSAKRLIGASESCQPDGDIDALRQVFLQYGQLSQEYDRSLQIFTTEQMKNMFILRILNGRYSSNEESANICRHLNISFPFPHYCACVLLFDGEPSEVERQLNGIVAGDFTAYFCQTENRASALGIVNCADPQRLAEIGEAILRQLDKGAAPSHATLAIGHSCEALQHVPVSYIEARTAMDYRLVFGLHTVILYDQTELCQSESPEYPRRQLNAFAQGLLNWDVDEIQAQLAGLVRTIRSGKLSLQQVKCVCMELSTSFMREVHNLNNSHPFRTERFDIFHICEYDSIDELVQHISELSASIKQYLESSETLCQDSDIHRCLALLDDRFDDCQFSLESLYDQFSISPQTLRRRFKNATGKTMSDYLTSLRIGKAKDLLATTGLELSDICLQCGYADQSSFIRAFKAREGMTPGKYRESARTKK